MAKAIWKGTISFGLVTIPVELFPAVSREELAFHLLDGRDMSPIHNKRVNESTGKEVPWESVVKGTQLDDGRWVTLTDGELKSANVRATRTIDILGAVCVEDIAVAMYETPYYLAPEAQGAKAYALLRESLRRAGRIAVGRIVIRTRQRLCALVPSGDALVLDVVRYPYELRDANDLDLPTDDLRALGVTEAEVGLAEQLVRAIETPWDPSKYRDTYHGDVAALIAKKAEGVEIPPPPEPEPVAEVVDIMDLLKRSVEDAKSKRAGARGA